jgi:hypothetical protein
MAAWTCVHSPTLTVEEHAVGQEEQRFGKVLEGDGAEAD